MRSSPVSERLRPAGLPAINSLRQVPAIRAQVGRTQPTQTQPAIASPSHHEAGILFRRIREVAGLTLVQTAQRLHTFPSVIDALERGDFEHLPPWPETVVVVSGYTALAGIDPRPVLTAIRAGLDSKIIDVQASEVPSRPARPALQHARPPIQLMPRRPFPVQAAPATHTAAAAGNIAPRGAILRQSVTNARLSVRRLANSAVQAAGQRLSPLVARTMALPVLSRVAPPWRMPVALSLAVTLPLAAIVIFGGSNPLHAAVSSLPAPISGAYRSIEDYVLRSMATEKNGLVWIEVRDPRTRKTDKLPSPRR